MKREIKLEAADPKASRKLVDKPCSNAVRIGGRWKQQSVKVMK
jgi:hypothetical protein